MARLALIIGALYGMTAVILGAFGAHGLKKALAPEKWNLINSFDTGVKYQMYHALALLAIGAYMKSMGDTSLVLDSSITVMSLGTLLFSGSIYLLVALQIQDSVGLGKLGIITPIGGTMLVIAWGMMLYHFIRS